MDVDQVEQVLDAELGEGHGAILVHRIIHSDHAVLRRHAKRQIGQPVFVPAEIAGDERQGPDVVGLVELHRQAATAVADRVRQFQGRSSASWP